jgi:predicted permease
VAGPTERAVTSILEALVPVLVLIALGWGLRRSHFIDDAVWSGIEKLTYFVLLPALLVATLGERSLDGMAWPAWFTVVTGTLLVAIAALFALPLRSGRGPASRDAEVGPAFTSVFQGGVRFNTYIALSLVQAFYGARGLAVGSMAAGLMILLVNLACIAVFARYGRARIAGTGPFLRAVFANPLILACLLGWALSLSGVGLPGVSGEVLAVVGRAALPLGLLAVGAALRPEAIRGHLPPAAWASLVQFGVKPVVAVLLVGLVGLRGMEAGVLLLMFCVPTASSAYILARQLGGDAESMASIITVQTLLAFALMPVALLVAERL